MNQLRLGMLAHVISESVLGKHVAEWSCTSTSASGVCSTNNNGGRDNSIITVIKTKRKKVEVSSIKEQDQLIINTKKKNLDGFLVSSLDTRWKMHNSSIACNTCNNMKSSIIISAPDSSDDIERKTYFKR